MRAALYCWYSSLCPVCVHENQCVKQTGVYQKLYLAKYTGGCTNKYANNCKKKGNASVNELYS